MKTIKIFFTVLLAALFSVSCSSDNDKETVTNYEVENPLNSVVAQVGLKRYDYMNNPSEELGLVFTPYCKRKHQSNYGKIAWRKSGAAGNDLGF
ncbi:hypothetical protein ACHRV5_21170 [Flavobacterium sp. FlaQc-52]|uniref:hypothetical protein n=1 Tax=Flavobacterium sp. FlaQc-52 TaxID=3374185 RepID=UPI00375778AE